VRFGITAIALAICGSCGSNSPTNGPKGRVSGQVLAGPTCPVEQPGDTNCEPVPVQGTVQFTQDGDVSDSVKIEPSGNFSIEIPAGLYTVVIDTGDNIFPTCSPVDVEVVANVDSEVDVFCDTGIR